MSKKVKIVVGVPESHADKVREAIAQAGAGKIGNYSHASFSCKGIGRFKPLEGANPAIGKIGQLEQVIEERIETDCAKKIVKEVVEAIRRAHPYEEPAIDIYPLEDL
ncbi:MAG: hypothetical protein Q8O32_00180 [bacterium]|nr:hypothetical protein [bacterium]